MKTVAQLMSKAVVTLPPDAIVAVAIQTMLKHHVGEILVVDRGQVVGIVTARDLLGQGHYRVLEDFMIRDVATIWADAPITVAYGLIERRGVGRLPVIEDKRLVGIITRSEILHELGRLTDPLTGLPWPGLLRQQAADLLRAGAEIVVIFIDLDRFRQVNRRLGHVAGDRVIVAVADALQGLTDPTHDLLCRYGGDEFAIVTTRRAEDAEALAEAIVQTITALTLPEMQGLSITAAIGLAGGKRGAERTDAYPSATVDDLITLGSRASSAAKQLNRRILHAHEIQALEALDRGLLEEETRLRLARVAVTMQEDRVSASVELDYDGRPYRGEAEGPSSENGVLRVLAQAAVQALAQLLPPSANAAVKGIGYTSLPPGDAVSIAILLRTPFGNETLMGIAPSVRYRPDAVVRAILRAVNRRLSVVQGKVVTLSERDGNDVLHQPRPQGRPTAKS